MKHSLVALTLLTACLAPFDFAAAQSTVQVTYKVVPACGSAGPYTAGSMNYPTVDVNGNVCGASGGAPSGTQDTNLKQVNGATVNVGTGAAGTGTQRVTTSTDSTVGITGNVTTLPATSAVTGSVSAATITSTSTQAVAAASRRLLSIDNESTTATIACAFGATAAINTAGSFTMLPSQTRTWKDYPVPADAVNCISSAATSPATLEVN